MTPEADEDRNPVSWGFPDDPEPDFDAIIAEILSGPGLDRDKDIAVRSLRGETQRVLAKHHGVGAALVAKVAARMRRRAVARLTDPYSLLEMSTRASNALRSEGIETIDQLRAYVAEHGHPRKWRIPNFGRISADEIWSFLQSVPE